MSGLPREPLTEEEILARLEEYRRADLDAHSGRVWAYVYEARRPEAERAALLASHAAGIVIIFAVQAVLDRPVLAFLLMAAAAVAGALLAWRLPRAAVRPD